MKFGISEMFARRVFLRKLEELGPTVALVGGNCDSNSDWPLVVDLVRNGVRFRLVHIPPSHGPENIDVLLHGHTHVPRNERRGDTLFLNPGCVTRPNRGAPASAAYLDIRPDGGIDWRLFELR
jgi:putative phosphoesterase